MRRALSLALLLLPGLARGAEPATVPVTPIKVSPHCYYVHGQSG